MKRLFDTQVQLLKYRVLKEVAHYMWEDKMEEAYVEIPERIVGDGLHIRCCQYKEKYIVQERVRLAKGRPGDGKPVIDVIPQACDECPVEGYLITEHCRGCLAHRCQDACPKEAITLDKRGKAHIDKERCIECGKCALVCPYSAIVNRKRPCEKACKVGAVKISGDCYSASIDQDKCIRCGACVYQCPFGAMIDRSYITEAVKLLKDKERKVYAVVAPAIAAQMTHHTIPQLIAAIKELGFFQVVEAALGADIVALSESEELREKGFLTSSCCPSFVDYIKKFQPEMAEHISHNPSPMVAVGRLIKSIDPGAAVVFIGPCTSKKFEAAENADAVDVALTFEELQALLDSRVIDWENLEEEDLNNASYFGRIFARTGGLSDAVRQALNESGHEDAVYEPVISDGIEECRKNLLLASRGKLKGNFIEGMACVNGCIGGAGNVTHAPKIKEDVDKYAKLAMEKTIGDSLRVFPKAQEAIEK